MDERITDEEYTLLLLSGLFDDEEIELLMLADAVERAESAPVHTKFKRFDLSCFTDEECRHNFCFSHTDLVALTTLLHMPPKYRAPNSDMGTTGRTVCCSPQTCISQSLG